MTIFDPAVFETWAASPYSLALLALFGFSESSFFLIPPEVLLIPLGLANPPLALFYALISTISSVLGGLFGYWIGIKGGKPILHRFFSEEKIEKVKVLFHKYDAWAILMAAFTPIPFKVFTIAAGVFEIDLKRMTVASIIGRGSRYFILGGLIFLFGDSIAYFLEHQFDTVILLGTIALLVAGFIWKIGWPFMEKRILKEGWQDRVSRWVRFR